MTRALITGASSGIGRALALAYAAEGADLVLFGRDADRLAEAAQACRDAGATNVETHIADVRDRETMAGLVKAADERGAIDLLVANAGVATGLSPGQILENPESVRATMAINVNGVFNTVEPVIPAMCARGGGQIAIVGSMAAVRSLPYSPAYCAAKSAVHMWADCLRGRLKTYGVSVSVIAPGFVETPMAARTKVRAPIGSSTKSWQQGAISDTEAAQIIKRGLDRRRPMIAFPLYVYYAMRLFSILPAAIVDAVMRRIHVVVPETHERGESS